MDNEQIKCNGNLTLPYEFAARMEAMLGEDFSVFCQSYAKDLKDRYSVLWVYDLYYR